MREFVPGIVLYHLARVEYIQLGRWRWLLRIRIPMMTGDTLAGPCRVVWWRKTPCKKGARFLADYLERRKEQINGY